MLGEAIKVSPVLTAKKGHVTFESFFPKGRWFDLNNWRHSIDSKKENGTVANLTRTDGKT